MNYRKVLIHIGFWALYVILEVLSNAAHYASYERDMLWANTLIYLPVIIISSYIISLGLVPHLLRKGNYLLFSICIIGLMIFIYLMRHQLTILFEYYFQENYIQLPLSKVLKNVIRDYAVITLAVCIQIIVEWQENLNRIKELTQSKAEVELNFLRSQLNPHFLFNTLNNIYSLARKKSDLAPESILKLSQILDYLIYECRQETIPLRKELAIIRDYIELERLRHGDRLRLQWEESIQLSEYAIQPLLLLTLVENAFKHGGVRDQFFCLNINVLQESEKLEFIIQNTIKLNHDNRQKSNGGIGLSNLTKQLELLYPNRYALTTMRNEQSFTTTLKIGS